MAIYAVNALLVVFAELLPVRNISEENVCNSRSNERGNPVSYAMSARASKSIDHRGLIQRRHRPVIVRPLR